MAARPQVPAGRPHRGGVEGDLTKRRGVELAERILEGLLDTAALLSHYSERGAHSREFLALGICDFRHAQFPPYRMIYRVLGKQVFLLVVADGRRDFQTLLERRLLGRA